MMFSMGSFLGNGFSNLTAKAVNKGYEWGSQFFPHQDKQVIVPSVVSNNTYRPNTPGTNWTWGKPQVYSKQAETLSPKSENIFAKGINGWNNLWDTAYKEDAGGKPTGLLSGITHSATDAFAATLPDYFMSKWGMKPQPQQVDTNAVHYQEDQHMGATSMFGVPQFFDSNQPREMYGVGYQQQEPVIVTAPGVMAGAPGGGLPLPIILIGVGVVGFFLFKNKIKFKK